MSNRRNTRRANRQAARQEKKENRQEKKDNRQAARQERRDMREDNQSGSSDLRNFRQQLEKENDNTIRRIRRNRRARRNMCDPPIPQNVRDSIKDITKIAETLAEELKCDEDCQFEKRRAELLQEKENAMSIYQTAPQKLRDSQQAYYNHISQREDMNYEIFEREHVDEIIKKRIEQFKKDFNLVKSLRFHLNNEVGTSKGQEIQNMMMELRDVYENGATHTEREKRVTLQNKRIAQRQLFYYDQNIVFYRSINLILSITSIFVILFYMLTFLYGHQEFKTIKEVISRILIFSPMIIMYIVMVVAYTQLSDQTLFRDIRNINPSIGERIRRNILWIYTYITSLFQSKCEHNIEKNYR